MAGKKIPRPKKVDTFFKGSPVESLKVVDIYKESPDPDNVLNSFKSLATAAKSKVAEVIKIPKFDLKELVSMVDLKDGLRLDRKALSARMMDSVGIREGEIPDTAKENIFRAMEGYLGLENGLVTNTVGKALDLRDNPPEDAAGFVDFLNGYLGGDSPIAGIVDSSPVLGFLKGTIEKAVEMGMPDALDALIAKVDSERDRVDILKTQVQQAALAADLETLKVIEKHMSPEEMLAQCPELVQYVLSGFRISRLRPDATLQNYYDELVGYFDHIDPKWVRVGVRTKLDSFTRASTDALTVFQTIGDYRTEALIARSYSPVDIIQRIKADYPNSTITA